MRTANAARKLQILYVLALATCSAEPVHAAPTVGTVTVRHPCVLIADLEAEMHAKAAEIDDNGPEVLIALRGQDGTTVLAVKVDEDVACVVWSSPAKGEGA